MTSPTSGVTMATIARAAGVVPSTVSKALRDDPTISPVRRREIQRLARSLGYRPNPLVAALMARLHSRRRRNDPHHLAWIDLWPDDQEAARTTDFKLMLRGANQRANELGYQIEVHRVARDGMGAARLHEILLSRCQWGVIIPPVPREAMDYHLDLEGLTGVTIGTSLHQPVMHRVASNLFQGCVLACRKLREHGFHRIGLALSPAMNERVEEKWLGAYLAEQTKWLKRERLPPLLVTSDDEAAFFQWCARLEPDVVLLAEAYIGGWIPRSRLPAARKPAVAWLRRIASMPESTFAIDTRPDKMGAAAVELVVAQIHRNERGSPQFPHTVLLDGVWCE
ncbi:MAG: LacI family DNA-binding transcriptional regulator [Opitutaceae bacterium]|nr:LacI family DNA-binding transcriptional regulator [Opitutaceae bacterium]